MSGQVLAFTGRQAFELLAQEHQAHLEAVAMRLTGNRSDTRDLVQDVLERAFRSFGRFQPGTNARVWLVTILNNAFIDRCRAQRRDRRSDEGPEELEHRLPAPEAEEPPPWEQVSSVELHRAVRRLPEELRATYVLHAMEGRSYDQISNQLSIAKNTVGTRLLRARRRLRVLLFGSPEVSG